MNDVTSTTVVIIPLTLGVGKSDSLPDSFLEGPHCLVDPERAATSEKIKPGCGKNERRERDAEWVPQTNTLLYGFDHRKHYHVTSDKEAALLPAWDWTCIGVEYLRVPAFAHTDSMPAHCFLLLHASTTADDPVAANHHLVRSLEQALGEESSHAPELPDWEIAQLPSAAKGILKSHSRTRKDQLKTVSVLHRAHRDTLLTRRSGGLGNFLGNTLTEAMRERSNAALYDKLSAVAAHTSLYPVQDPDDHYTQQLSRLSPSPSWKLVAARSGLAMGVTHTEDGQTFGDYLPLLARSIYTDVMLLTLIQARAASTVADTAADLYAASSSARKPVHKAVVVAPGEKTADGSAASNSIPKVKPSDLSEWIVDLRVGPHRMQPWARGGVFVDVHKALQDQYRIQDRIAEAEDLMGRVTAAIEARATKRATETLSFLSALVLLPTAIASFGSIWLDHGAKEGFYTTVIISGLAALMMFAWIHRGWGLSGRTALARDALDDPATPTSTQGHNDT